MGMACPFAHSKEELNAPPDLSKTKLCAPSSERLAQKASHEGLMTENNAIAFVCR